MSGRARWGLMLPHFGSTAKRERLFRAAIRAEAAGFDSVWVRDHLVFHPHPFEDQNRNLIDPFVALTAAATLTSRVNLGFACLIPHRHPIQTALLIGSLDFLAGPGRVILGCGTGTYSHEFAAVGISADDRRRLLLEQLAIMRTLWTGSIATYEGDYYRFVDVDVHPTPTATVPVWYCGTGPTSVRWAVDNCDGWMPGRMPGWVLAKRLQRMRALTAERGLARKPSVGIVSWVSIAPSVELAEQRFEVDHLLADAVRSYGDFPNAAGGRIADLDGAAMAGPPDVIAEQALRYADLGAEHIIFDLRSRSDEWDDSFAFFAEEVLPRLRAA